MVETRRLTQLTSGGVALLDLPDGDLVVALSGGADSAALAYMLVSIGRPFRALHVDHGLVDSPRLERAADEVASTLGIGLETVSIEIPPGASAEAQARSARYRALESRLTPGEWLLTAHTMDDQAETVLMNLIRGTGTTGLAGIPPRSGVVARPMLALSRSWARELASLAGLPYHDDPTNLDPAIQRNAIRLEVLPQLSARFNPRLVEALARTSSLVRSDEEYLEQLSRSVAIIDRGSWIGVAAGSLQTVPRPLADRVLRRCLSLIRPPYAGTAAELSQIWAVAGGERRAAGLAGGIEVALEGPLLVFERQSHKPAPSGDVELAVGTQTIGRFELSVERVDRVCRVAPLGSWSAIFDPEATLQARLEEGGDRLVVMADGEPAWVPGGARLAVAWYRPGTSGYLSVFAKEESGWRSSP